MRVGCWLGSVLLSCPLPSTGSGWALHSNGHNTSHTPQQGAELPSACAVRGVLLALLACAWRVLRACLPTAGHVLAAGQAAHRGSPRRGNAGAAGLVCVHAATPAGSWRQACQHARTLPSSATTASVTALGARMCARRAACVWCQAPHSLPWKPSPATQARRVAERMMATAGTLRRVVVVWLALGLGTRYTL